MPSGDWTSISNGSGSFAIIADGTAPSPPDVMQITTGGQMFQNLTSGTFRDSRITAWCRQQSANNSPLLLVLRSLNATYSAAPATYFIATVYATGPTTISYELAAVVGGVTTTILNVAVTSQNGNPVNTWQQFQFSAFNSGTDILLRIAQWNGSAFVPIGDCAAPIASFPTLNAVGRGRFGAFIGGSAVLLDDIAFYSLV